MLSNQLSLHHRLHREKPKVTEAWTGLVSVSQWVHLSFSLTQEGQGKAGLEEERRHEKAEESERPHPNHLPITKR